MHISPLAAAVALAIPLCSRAFYLPGAAPHNFVQGEQVNLFVNALTPMISSANDAKLVRDIAIFLSNDTDLQLAIEILD